jgi:hypothetical protein
MLAAHSARNTQSASSCGDGPCINPAASVSKLQTLKAQ